MEKKVKVFLGVFLRLLKNEKMGFEVYKDGTMAFVDTSTGERMAIEAEELQKFYNLI